MKVCLRIKEIRKIRGMTQEQVSRALDIPNSTYRGIENNKHDKCKYIILFKLVKILNVDTIEDLFYVD